MTILQKKLLTFLLWLLIASPLLGHAYAAHAANITQQMTNALTNVALPSTGTDEGKIQVIVGKVISAFLSIFGIIFLILMIYGGYRWMMASGRDEEITKAKDTIRAAIIGLIIVLSAYAIAFFVTTAIQTAAQ